MFTDEYGSEELSLALKGTETGQLFALLFQDSHQNQMVQFCKYIERAIFCVYNYCVHVFHVVSTSIIIIHHLVLIKAIIISDHFTRS